MHFKFSLQIVPSHIKDINTTPNNWATMGHRKLKLRASLTVTLTEQANSTPTLYPSGGAPLGGRPRPVEPVRPMFEPGGGVPLGGRPRPADALRPVRPRLERGGGVPLGGRPCPNRWSLSPRTSTPSVSTVITGAEVTEASAAEPASKETSAAEPVPKKKRQAQQQPIPERPKRTRTETERMKDYKEELADATEKKKESVKKQQSMQPVTKAAKKKSAKKQYMQPASPGGGQSRVEPGEPVPLRVLDVIIGTSGDCSFTFADMDENKVDNGKAYSLAELQFMRDYHQAVLDHCVEHRIAFVPRIVNAHRWLKAATETEDYKSLQRS